MTMHKYPNLDLPRITLQVLWIIIMIAASFWIMRPFLLALVWAATIVVATWPYMLIVEGWCRKRSLAVAVMTIVMLLLFIVPFSLAIIAIIDNSDRISEWVKSFQTQELPTLPSALSGLPMVGPKLAASWENFRTGPEGLSARLAPYARQLLRWFLSQAGNVGIIILQFLLTVIIAAILYSGGETASKGVLRFAHRLGGIRGEESAVLAAKTVRSVAIGVVGTALIQSFFGGLGLAIVGVPAALLLTGVMFILCIAQLGVGFVLIPAVFWVFWSGQTAWGFALLVWSIFVLTFDNILRPLLIKRGAAELPLVLIFAGVIGGLISFGVVGLFVGPVVLSVSYKLLGVWVNEMEESLS